MQTRNSEQGSQQSEGAKTTRSSLELSYLAAIACHGPTTVAATSHNGGRKVTEWVQGERLELTAARDLEEARKTHRVAVFLWASSTDVHRAG